MWPTLLRPADRKPCVLDDFLRDLPASRPFEQAVWAGHRAPCVGFAFAAGYRAALRALIGEPAAALCVTEAGGNSPRAIETQLATGKITGTKVWATLAQQGEMLLVACSTGWTDGRNQLVLAKVDPAGPGVRLDAQPNTPFVPEIPHFRVQLEGAPAAEVLPGDAWTTYIKPFRTVEDIHVFGAAVAWILGTNVPNASQRAALLAAVTTLGALAAEDPNEPAVHLVLGHTLSRATQTVDDLAFPASSTWHRDRPLLSVADRARRRRYELALAGLD